MNEEKSRLSRWSQRKAAARRGEAVDNDAVAPAPPEETPAPVAAQAEPEAEAEAPVLPSIDELNAQSDYTVFLAKHVPEALRRAALRKLWTSDPVLANLDGLNDYDEDYNLVSQAISLAQSSYRPGLGHETESKPERSDEAFGGSGASAVGSPEERPEEGAAPAPSESENDAAVNETADDAQQAPGPASSEPTKESGE